MRAVALDLAQRGAEGAAAFCEAELLAALLLRVSPPIVRLGPQQPGGCCLGVSFKNEWMMIG